MNKENPFGIAETGKLIPGQVALANEGAVNNQFLSEALTQYAVGWTNPELDPVLTLICGAPIVVSKKFNFKKYDNKEAFAACENDDDVRAIGADFKLIKTSGEVVDSHTLSKGLTIRIDRDEVNDDPEIEQKSVAHLLTVLKRAEILRALNGIAGAATNAAKTWGTGQNKADADADVVAMLIAGTKSAGIKPNQVLFGMTAAQKRFLTLRDSNNTAVAGSAVLTNEQLAGLYGVKKVDRLDHVYQNGASKAAMIDSLVLAYNVSQSGLKEDPANIKRFITNMRGAGEWGVYKEEHGAFIDITVAHQSRIVIPNSLGIQKLTIS